MVRMRMVNADDVPRAVLELSLNPQLVCRVHEVSVTRAFDVQVPACAERMNSVVLFHIRGPDHQTATFVGIRCFCVLIDVAQNRSRYLDHNSFETFTAPPLKRLIASANSSFGIVAVGGANVIHKIRVQPSATRVRMESEMGLPNGPSW